MTRTVHLSALLAAPDDISHAHYTDLVDNIVQKPQQIEELVSVSQRDATLIHVTTRSSRLVRVFQGLRRFQELYPKSLSTPKLGNTTIYFCLNVLQQLNDFLDPLTLLELLVPVLAVSIASPKHSLQRRLAALILECGDTVELLISDREGSKVVQNWVEHSESTIYDARVLQEWTSRVINLARSCVDQHEATSVIQRWDDLLRIKGTFYGLARSQDHMDQTSSSEQQAAKKELNPSREHHQRTSLEIDAKSLSIIQHFGLERPTSSWAAQQAIKDLEGAQTSDILRSICFTFHCEVCKSSIGSHRTTPVFPVPEDESSEAVSRSQFGSTVFGRTKDLWRIVLSELALKTLRKLDEGGLAPIRTKLNDMASGLWNVHATIRELKDQKLLIPLATTQCGRQGSEDNLILWHIDMFPIASESGIRQCIRVWEVGTRHKILRIAQKAALLHRNYSQDAINFCLVLPTKNDHRFIPHTLLYPQTHTEMIRQNANLDVRTLDQETVELAHKWYPLTKSVMSSLSANDLVADFPFELSDEEMRVISHIETPTLILGRSGTGKTTCLALKMIGKYIASLTASPDRPIHQLLLTRSPLLVEKLSLYTKSLIRSLRPVMGALLTAESGRSAGSAASLVRKMDATQLTSDMFPLVCTFEDFVTMLENTAGFLDRKATKTAHSLQHGAAYTLVDFNRFRTEYWPHFAEKVKSGLSVNAVFPEIMGVIQGSVASTQTFRALSRDDYVGMALRKAPTFPADEERHRVYTLYEAYQHMKIELGHMDDIDRIIQIVKAIHGNHTLRSILSSKLSEIYIDEVQDHRCVDLELFMSFINDKRGFHFAGDTAQTISLDTSFRFEDARTLFSQHLPTNGSEKNNRASLPTNFSLSANYRSHQGILSLAGLVLEMMWTAFPDFVDKLTPERGVLNGPKPVLFVECDSRIIVSSSLGLSGLSQRAAEFGAEQVILVRDGEAKRILQKQIGEAALVLTVLEAKGMEFDDVLLWQFFSTSPHQTSLRRIESLLGGRSREAGRDNPQMCLELKLLYVAITRARFRLFLIEGQEKQISTVVRVLHGSNSQRDDTSFVDLARPNTPFFNETLAAIRDSATSDPTKWEAQGWRLLDFGNFKDAAFCFRKSKNDIAEKQAMAHAAEEDGMTFESGGRRKESQDSYQVAVNLFMDLKKIEDAARIFEERLKDASAAAELWEKHGILDKAASLYAQATLHIKAANCYNQLSQHDQAIVSLRKGGHFNELVMYLSDIWSSLTAKTAQQNTRLCKLLLKQHKVSDSHRQYAIQALGSAEEQETTLLEYELYQDLDTLYQQQSRFEELFSSKVTKGKLMEALEVSLTYDLCRDEYPRVKSLTLRLLKYLCAQICFKVWKKEASAFEFPMKEICMMQPELAVVAESWERASTLSTPRGHHGERIMTDVNDPFVQISLSVVVLSDISVFQQTQSFSELPFALLEHAIAFASRLASSADEYTLDTVRLVGGVWQANDSSLPSVTGTSLIEVRTGDEQESTAETTITVEIYKVVSLAILAFDKRARDLWKVARPERCQKFLRLGYCPLKRQGAECTYDHEIMTSEDCAQKIDDLLLINRLVCSANAFYLRRVSSEEFSKSFLPIRRHWLERLLRELTFVSSCDQDSTHLQSRRNSLLRDARLRGVESSLENLLYHRLARQWANNSTHSALLEQIQVATMFGRQVQSRFFRALSSKLYHEQGGRAMQQDLQDLLQLQYTFHDQSPFDFKRRIGRFLAQLAQINPQGLSSLHALTAVFENLSLLIVLRLNPKAIVLPTSWIECRLPHLSQTILTATPVAARDQQVYRQCLVRLVEDFCRLLYFLDGPMMARDYALMCCGKTNREPFVQSRNVDFLLTCLVNLELQGKLPNALINPVNNVLGLNLVRASHLRFENPTEMTRKLIGSFGIYEGKDSLVLVSDSTELATSSGAYRALGNHPHVHKSTLHSLQVRMRLDGPRPGASAQESDADQQYGETDTKAAVILQRFWKKRGPFITRRRAWLKKPKALQFARLIAITSTLKAPLRVRSSLMSGDAAIPRVELLQERVKTFRKKVLHVLGQVELQEEQSEQIDLNLHRLSQFDSKLKAVIEGLSEEGLLASLEEPDMVGDVINSYLETAEAIEQEMPNVTKAIRSIERKTALKKPPADAEARQM